MSSTDRPARRHRTVLLIGAGVVLLDQVTKAICVATMPLYSRVTLVDGLLDLTHVRNRGMAFGVFNSIHADWLRWVLVAVAIGAVGIIWSYARKESHRLVVLLAFGAILGGAVGNLIDRLRLGYVVDFVLAHWGLHEFPAFNVADSAITMGGIVLFLTLARDDGKELASLPSPTTGAELAAGHEPDERS